MPLQRSATAHAPELLETHLGKYSSEAPSPGCHGEELDVCQFVVIVISKEWGG